MTPLEIGMTTRSPSPHDASLLPGLLEDSARGLDTSFADLYLQTSPQIYNTVLQVLRSQAHAEEVTQEVFIQVWQQAAAYDRSKARSSAG